MPNGQQPKKEAQTMLFEFSKTRDLDDYMFFMSPVGLNQEDTTSSESSTTSQHILKKRRGSLLTTAEQRSMGVTKELQKRKTPMNRKTVTQEQQIHIDMILSKSRKELLDRERGDILQIFLVAAKDPNYYGIDYFFYNLSLQLLKFNNNNTFIAKTTTLTPTTISGSANKDEKISSSSSSFCYC